MTTLSKAQAYSTLFAIMLVVLLSSAGIALPYPILAPLFLNEVTPLTQFANLPPKLLLGIVLAVYPLGVLIGSSVIGAASDIYGRKKVLIISLSLSMLGYLLSALAIIYQNYPAFLLTRFITGLCEGNISVAKAIAIDLSPTLDKTRTFSFINATGYAGWLLGPLAGGLLQPYGIDFVFYVATIATLFAIFAVIFLLSNQLNPITDTPKSWQTLLHQQNSFSLLKNIEIRKIFYIYLLATLGLNAYYEFYPVWLVEHFDFNSPQIGYITALLTVCMLLTSLLFVSKIKRKLGLINGSLVGLSSFALMLFIHPLLNAHSVWFTYIFIGITIAIFNGLLPVYISNTFHHVGQGQLMGLLTTTFSLANVIMAIVGSFIALIGSAWSLAFGGLLLLISAASFYQVTKKSQYKTNELA